MKKFIVKYPDGTLSAPLKPHELLDLGAVGRITPDCMVRIDGRPGNWYRAGSIAAIRFPDLQLNAKPRSLDASPVASVDSGADFSVQRGAVGVFPAALWDPLGTVTRLALVASEWTMVMVGCGLHLLATIALIIAVWTANIPEIRDLDRWDFGKDALAISGCLLAALTLTNALTRLCFARDTSFRIGLDLLAAAVTWLPLTVAATIVFAAFGDVGALPEQSSHIAGWIIVVGASLFVVVGYALSDRLGLASSSVLILLTPVRLFALFFIADWLYTKLFADLGV
jgi:hypothetical protein